MPFVVINNISHSWSPRWSLLALLAIRSKDEKYVQQLLEEGTPVNGILGAGCTKFAYPTSLHLAVTSRNTRLVKLLLDKGVHAYAKNWHGETPLMVAAKLQDLTSIDLLLSHDFKDSRDDDGFRHLHIACMRNRLDLVKEVILLNQGSYMNADVSRESLHWPSYTALHFAVHFGSIEVVEFLLHCGADITVGDSRHFTPLHLADLQQNEIIIDMILVAHKSEFKNPKDLHGYSHFHIACTRDDPSIVEHFLKIGVDIDLEVQSSRWEGWRPIHFAIYNDCMHVLKLLLQNQTSMKSECVSRLLVDAFLVENQTVQNLIQVVRFNNSAMVKKVENKLNQLYVDCIHSNDEKMRELLSDNQYNHGKLKNFVDRESPLWDGSTLLHLAARYQSELVKDSLLDYVPDIMVQDCQGKTPLHIAFERGSQTIAHLIVEKIVIPCQSLSDNNGLSTFHILCTTDRLDLIENFLKSGEDINAQVGNQSVFWSDVTPLHFACKFIKPRVVECLLKYNASVSILNRFNLNLFDFTTHELYSSDYISQNQSRFEILMKILIYGGQDAGEKFNVSNEQGILPLHAFCASSSVNFGNC
ncbi:hypothetical protein QAD02_001239 [Eretmocerus hayati]|uniref:Uncharacterized protein n=1 Tax=Eretmocerus hayati TaxID=131215 RepID=A0ACC2NFN5_9HYME|nr:hypothetical protein QAD02_001239 [Eretmocerus hayati]